MDDSVSFIHDLINSLANQVLLELNELINYSIICERNKIQKNAYECQMNHLRTIEKQNKQKLDLHYKELSKKMQEEENILSRRLEREKMKNKEEEKRLKILLYQKVREAEIENDRKRRMRLNLLKEKELEFQKKKESIDQQIEQLRINKERNDEIIYQFEKKREKEICNIC